MADAEETAIAALGWLAGQPDLINRFLALTGLEPSGLRAAASEPGFLAGVLSFLMNHEPTLMAFCEGTGERPEAVAAAFRTLSPQEPYL